MYYAGIDAHAKYLRIAVVNKVGGAVVAETTIKSRDVDGLCAFLSRFQPIEVVVETCPFWPWIQEALEETGIPFHLAHAKQLRAIAENAQKNDTVDGRLLARMLATGLIPHAMPRSRQQREWLRLLRHRVWLVRLRTMAVNRIHAQLHQTGLSLPREQLLRKEGTRFLKENAWPLLTPEQRRIVRTHLRVIANLGRMIRDLSRVICQTAEENSQVQRLCSIPGIGPFWGLLLVAEILPVERFSSAAKFVSYCGLAPRTASSGGHTWHGSLPAGANRWVRWALISATATHMRRRPDTRFGRDYQTLKARLGWKKARVAAARKLARSVYAMLKNESVWKDA
jgi:transposase